MPVLVVTDKNYAHSILAKILQGYDKIDGLCKFIKSNRLDFSIKKLENLHKKLSILLIFLTECLSTVCAVNVSKELEY